MGGGRVKGHKTVKRWALCEVEWLTGLVLMDIYRRQQTGQSVDR